MRFPWQWLALSTALTLTAGCQRHACRCSCCSGQVTTAPPGVLAPVGAQPSRTVERPQANPFSPPQAEPADTVEIIPLPQLEKPVNTTSSPAKPSAERLFPDRHPTTASHPGHAADYSWLIGELQYVHVRDVWRIRYAPADEEDRYGGSVTLIETGPMTAYRPGQRVRVEGQPVEPESREPSPVYRVHSIQPMSQP